MDDTSPEVAMRVKGRIEKTILRDVIEYIDEICLRDDNFLLIKLNLDLIKSLKLEVGANSIHYS